MSSGVPGGQRGDTPGTPGVGVVVEYVHRGKPGDLWLDVLIDRAPYAQLGPFATEEDRLRVETDLLDICRSLGAVDLPLLAQ